MTQLLISSSTVYGCGYLDHAEPAIRDLFAGCRRIAFVPYALFDRDAYANKVIARLQGMGLTAVSVHTAADPVAAIASADGIFVGGGNTFRLLDCLHRFGLIEAIRARIAQGAPYLGSSAGSIVAGPTIKTTKDMPIVEPPSFNALHLVEFQISPHFLDPDPNSKHMGETQEERVLQFLEENDRMVVGLREASFIRCSQDGAILEGPLIARIFRRGHKPSEVPVGSNLLRFISRTAERTYESC